MQQGNEQSRHLENNWNLNRKTDMRMMNIVMVKGYGAGEEQSKDDIVIDEDLQSVTKMDQQEPHNLVMGSRVNANYMTSDWSDVASWLISIIQK